MGFLNNILGGGGGQNGDPMNIFGSAGPFNGGDPSVNGGLLNQGLSGGNTPQQQGYGIGDSPGFSPWNVGPGLQPGQGYNASFDISGPGAAESYWRGLQGKAFNAPVEANLDPYYTRARERTANDMNKQLAARGQFGSSIGTGMLGDALGGLSAEQANREADYQLRRAASEMGWMGGMGNLAGQAQAAQQGRIGDLFGYNMALGDRASQNYFDQMNRLLGDDQNAMQSAMAAEMGLADQALGQGYRGEERHKADADWAAGIFGKVLGGMAGA